MLFRHQPLVFERLVVLAPDDERAGVYIGYGNVIQRGVAAVLDFCGFGFEVVSGKLGFR